MGKWWAAPFAIALHIYAISSSNHKKQSAFIFALTFNLLLLHWTSTYVGSTPWIILAFGLSLFYLPLALVGRWGTGAYPLLFILAEEVRNHFPFGGFGWARIAYSQPDSPYANIASLGGAIALSATTVLIGLFVFLLFNSQFKLLILIPGLLLHFPINIATTGQSTALLIQGNVPKYGLDFNSRAKEVFMNHIQVSKIALGKQENVDFLLWPENSVDVDPYANKDVFEQLQSFEKPLIIGAIMEKGGKLLNTSIFWETDGQEIYVKQHLTPFGEYIPFRSISSKISDIAGQVSDFYPGNQGKVFVIGKAKISPVICYELLDDQILHNAAINSNLLVVQTNSATFGKSAESAQQLSITRVRAIEHARNILSVSTTGYSAVIDYKGSVLQRSTMGTAEHLYANVGLIDQKSFRDRAGNWASVWTIFWLLLIARRVRT